MQLLPEAEDNMGGKPNNDVETLVSYLSTKLAPAVLELMNNLGYEFRFAFYDPEGTEIGVSKSDVMLLIESPDLVFAPNPYASRFTSNYDQIDERHRRILREFKDMKVAFNALSERHKEVIEAIQWIDTIGTVYQRRVITEKFNARKTSI